jgi:patatin-like phospholipase/acyl hydrolase
MRRPLKVPPGVREIPQPEPWRILALSGGGYRGLFGAEVLVRLERAIGSPLTRRLALFAGTSVGGLIAAGLAIGRPAEELRDAIALHGPRIFDDRVRLGPIILYHKPKGHYGGLFRSKFNAKALEAAIDAILGDDRDLRVSDVPCPLVLVATCATSMSPFLISSLRPGTPGADLLLRDALLATSAAPGYFPALDLDLRTLVDGGLVANAPELVACAELADVRSVEPADMRILSIGTAAPDAGAVPAQIGRRGLIKWLKGDLVPMILDAQEKLVTAQAAALFGRNYLRINASPAVAQGEVLALDLATDQATRTLFLLAEEATGIATVKQVKELLGIR